MCMCFDSSVKCSSIIYRRRDRSKGIYWKILQSKKRRSIKPLGCSTAKHAYNRVYASHDETTKAYR